MISMVPDRVIWSRSNCDGADSSADVMVHSAQVLIILPLAGDLQQNQLCDL